MNIRRAELTRHFFRQLFQEDLSSLGEGQKKLLYGILAVFGLLAVYTPPRLIRKYVDLFVYQRWVLLREVAIADALTLITASMMFLALVVVVRWNGLYPSARDYLILGPLPIRRRDIFLAKLTALAGFYGVFVGVITLLPALVFPLVQYFAWNDPLLAVRGIAAYAITGAAACAFVVCVLLAVQGLLLNLLPPAVRERVSGSVQALLGLLAFTGLLSSVQCSNLAGRLATLPDWFYAMPPVWFLGLHQYLHGAREPHFAPLAAQAGLALLGSLLLAAAVYAATYRRFVYLVTTPARAARRRTGTRPLLESLIHRLLPVPEQRALAGFVWRTLTRCRGHQLIFVVFLGAGLALATDRFLDLAFRAHLLRGARQQREWTQAVLAVGPILTFLSLFGFRFSSAFPVEERANLVFQLAGGHRDPSLLAGLAKILFFVFQLPFIFLSAVLAGTLLGWPVAGLHFLTLTLLCLVVIETTLLNWEALPYTRAFGLGAQYPTQAVLLYWAGFFVYVFLTSGIEAWAMQRPVRFVPLWGLLLVALAVVRRIRAVSIDLHRFQFQPAPEWSVLTLKIGGE